MEAVAALRDAANGDRARVKGGTTNDVGEQIDQLYRQSNGGGAFVSHGVAELGTRLRQLDCAVRHGRVNGGDADARYAQLLADLQAEADVLDGGSRRAVNK
jgi:hypothetical protein